MTAESDTKTIVSYSRLAGLAYFVSIVVALINVNSIDASLIDHNNAAATFENISKHEGLFRLGLALEILMWALVILLSVTLFVTLAKVDYNLALIAMVFRVAEAVIGLGIVVTSGMVPLMLIHNADLVGTQTAQALAATLIKAEGAGFDVALIFIGIGGTIFFYLFYKSRYIPRILSVWGIFTYLSMLTVSIASVMTPGFPEWVKLALFAPGGIFEILIGLWLMIKGVDTRQVVNQLKGN